jgi:hypothetical protein
MSIDLFDTRTMLAALEQMKPAKTFFLDTFFQNVEVSLTKNVDIDVQKGARRLAPFISPSLQGKVIDKSGYTTFSFAPPYVKPKMITTAADIMKRAMGQNIYASGGRTGEELASMQLGKDLAELDEMITRREEWMAAQAVQTGKVAIVGDGVNGEVDFNFDTNHLVTLSGNDLWSDTTNSTPIEDLEDWAELIGKDCGLTVDTVVMGKDAARAFINHPDVQKKLDQLKFNIAAIAPSKIMPGARYLGTVNSVADIYVYHEWYHNGTAEVAMMDTKKVLLGSKSARCTRHYGLIQDLECPAAVARFPKSWIEKDPSGQIVMLQSAPLPAIHQPDGFVCAKVLA